MLPFVLAIAGWITKFDSLYVTLYNLMLSALIASAAFFAHRIKNFKALEQFSWLVYLSFIPVILYLRYTGMLDEERHDTLVVDFLLDIIIIFVGYTAFPLSPKEKALGSSIFIVGVLTIYGTYTSVIPVGVTGFLSVAIAYSIGSLLGFGNALLIDNARILAYQGLSQEKILNDELSEKNAQLTIALDEVNALSGMLPICSSCKKIRNDDGYYQQIELYIVEHSEAEFTHGICPDCETILYPDL